MGLIAKLKDRVGDQHQRKVKVKKLLLGMNLTDGLLFKIAIYTLLISFAYAAFGIVTKGIEVVDAIVRSPRDYSDKPHQDIVIESVTIDLKGIAYPKPQYV